MMAGEHLKSLGRTLAPVVLAGAVSGVLTGTAAVVAVSVNIDWLRQEVGRLDDRIDRTAHRVDRLEGFHWRAPADER